MLNTNQEDFTEIANDVHLKKHMIGTLESIILWKLLEKFPEHKELPDIKKFLEQREKLQNELKEIASALGIDTEIT
jgi:type II restriction/modification system DNA methylase subunit YeeA